MCRGVPGVTSTLVVTVMPSASALPPLLPPTDDAPPPLTSLRSHLLYASPLWLSLESTMCSSLELSPSSIICLLKRRLDMEPMVEVAPPGIWSSEYWFWFLLYPGVAPLLPLLETIQRLLEKRGLMAAALTASPPA